MRRQGLVLRSSSAADIIEPMDPRIVSKQRKKDAKEVKAQKQLNRAMRKREAKLKSKVDDQAEVIASSRQLVQKLNNQP